MKKQLWIFLIFPLYFLVSCEGLTPVTPNPPTPNEKKATLNNQSIELTYTYNMRNDIAGDKELIDLLGAELNVNTTNTTRYIEADIDFRNNLGFDFTGTYNFSFGDAIHHQSFFLLAGETKKIRAYFFMTNPNATEVLCNVTNPIFGAGSSSTITLPTNVIDNQQNKVSKPCGIVISGNKIAVSEVPFTGFNNSVIKVWNSLTDFQNNAAPAKTLVADEPEAMAVSPINGHLAVCENWQKKIVIYDANWQNVVATLGLTDNLNYPRGIAFDKRGDLYVCDDYNHRILKYNYFVDNYDATPRVLLTLEGNSAPKDIAVDEDGNLYIADYAYGLRKFNKKAGNVYTLPADKTTNWVGNAVNLELKNNLLWVSYHNPGKVIAYNPYSFQTPTRVTPTNPELTGFATEQQDIAVDDNNNVYIADYTGNKVLVYKK